MGVEPTLRQRYAGSLPLDDTHLIYRAGTIDSPGTELRTGDVHWYVRFYHLLRAYVD